MKFGLFAMNMYACSYPETAIQVAQLAEEAGFESLWAGEHVGWGMCGLGNIKYTHIWACIAPGCHCQ